MSSKYNNHPINETQQRHFRNKSKPNKSFNLNFIVANKKNEEISIRETRFTNEISENAAVICA